MNAKKIKKELLTLAKKLGNNSISLSDAEAIILETLDATEDPELEGILMEAVALDQPSAQELKYYTPQVFITAIRNYYKKH